MANTCYKECLWLTRAITGEYGAGEFKNGDGYRLESLAKSYSKEFRSYYDMTDPKEKKQFSVYIWRWRMRLYFQFGLIVFSDSTDAAIKKKGNGGYYYYLANPEILDEGGRTLRQHMEFLAKFENNIPETVDWDELRKKYAAASQTMGFLSSGDSSAYGYQLTPGTPPRRILGEASLQDVQFAMLVGEALTIKYGKVRTGVNINAPYSLEPYQLKEIEGRWYVIGNVYPLGHKEKAELAVYDLGRLQFADEENPDVQYMPVKGFDVNDKILLDFAAKRKMGQVIALKLTTHTSELAKYITDTPLCSAQVDRQEGTYILYILFTNDLIIQLGAYGAELSFEAYDLCTRLVDHREELLFERIDSPVLHALNLFRNTGE